MSAIKDITYQFPNMLAEDLEQEIDVDSYQAQQVISEIIDNNVLFPVEQEQVSEHISVFQTARIVANKKYRGAGVQNLVLAESVIFPILASQKGSTVVKNYLQSRFGMREMLSDGSYGKVVDNDQENLVAGYYASVHGYGAVVRNNAPIIRAQKKFGNLIQLKKWDNVQEQVHKLLNYIITPNQAYAQELRTQFLA